MLPLFKNSPEDGPPGAGARPLPRWVPILAAMVFAALMVLPTLFKGNASGHDFEFHLASWIEVARQWHQGILYPRWAPGAHYGFGEPRFIFYPPLSWILGAALGSILPWPAVPGAFAWVSLTLAGLAAYRLAREWKSPKVALWAAALYAANPYNLINIYHRSAFAELLETAFFPLAVMFALRLARRPAEKNSGDGIVPLALVVAAAWLSNVPAAVVTCYSVALLLGISAVRQRSFAPVLRGGFAGALGFALCGFYVLPAIYEQKWIHVSEAFAGGLSVQANFLFSPGISPEHHVFNLFVSTVAVAELALAAIVFAAAWRHARNSAGEDEVAGIISLREAILLIAWMGIVSGLLLFRPSLPLWELAPFLKYVQFPWRWLTVLNTAIAFATAATVASSRRLPKLVGVLVLAAWLVLGGAILNGPVWAGTDVDDYAAAIVSGAGYESIDEYVIGATDRELLAPKSPQVAIADADSPPASLHFTVEKWEAEEKLLSVETPDPVRLELRLQNYPAWEVEVNGVPGKIESHPDTGQLIVSAPAGRSRVRVFFARTSDRIAGAGVSLAAIGIAAALMLAGRRTRAG